VWHRHGGRSSGGCGPADDPRVTHLPLRLMDLTRLSGGARREGEPPLPSTSPPPMPPSGGDASRRRDSQREGRQAPPLHFHDNARGRGFRDEPSHSRSRHRSEQSRHGYRNDRSDARYRNRSPDKGPARGWSNSYRHTAPHEPAPAPLIPSQHSREFVPRLDRRGQQALPPEPARRGYGGSDGIRHGDRSLKRLRSVSSVEDGEITPSGSRGRHHPSKSHYFRVDEWQVIDDAVEKVLSSFKSIPPAEELAFNKAYACALDNKKTAYPELDFPDCPEDVLLEGLPAFWDAPIRPLEHDRWYLNVDRVRKDPNTEGPTVALVDSGPPAGRDPRLDLPSPLGGAMRTFYVPRLAGDVDKEGRPITKDQKRVNSVAELSRMVRSQQYKLKKYNYVMMPDDMVDPEAGAWFYEDKNKNMLGPHKMEELRERVMREGGDRELNMGMSIYRPSDDLWAMLMPYRLTRSMFGAKGEAQQQQHSKRECSLDMDLFKREQNREFEQCKGFATEEDLFPMHYHAYTRREMYHDLFENIKNTMIGSALKKLVS